jgi:hypothetical protein
MVFKWRETAAFLYSLVQKFRAENRQFPATRSPLFENTGIPGPKKNMFAIFGGRG